MRTALSIASSASVHPRFGGWKLFGGKAAEAVKTDITAQAPVKSEGGVQGDVVTLSKPPDVFVVSQAGSQKTAQITLDELLGTLSKDTLTALDELLTQKGIEKNGKPILLEDYSGEGKIKAILITGSDNKRCVWTDIYGDDNHPLLTKLSEKFHFSPFSETQQKDEIKYELPVVSSEFVQATAYGMSLKENGEVSANEKLHMYVGKNFLVTTHEQKSPTVQKTMQMLRDTGTYKTPSELMAFIMKYNVNRYDNVIDSLKRDFTAMDEKVTKQVTDDTILSDSLTLGRKIDAMYDTATSQKEVLQELDALNDFHNSPLVPNERLEELTETLIHEMEELTHYQSRKDGIMDIYRAKISNDQDDAMKRLAAMAMLAAPATVTGGLMGMNVPLPIEGPGAFLWIVGGIVAVTGGLFTALRHKKWI